MIDFLLARGNPSIQLRVKKEVLHTITPEEEKALQEQILTEKTVRFIGEKQLENGWIGLGFHGSSKNAGQYDNQETGTKYLGEKGLKGTTIYGICSVNIYDGEFRGWSPYFGAQLETDWRAKVRRQCDITFRALLIMHYAGVE